jgi:hypothetical protein
VSILHDSLVAWFDAEDAREAKERHVHRLYYGSDLAPSACERAIWYRCHGAPKAKLSLATRLMFEAGHRVEKLLLDAVERCGRLVSRQGQVRPVRPSAWAWSGRYDAIVSEQRGPEETIDGKVIRSLTPDRHVVVDVKTARSHAFKTKDPLRIVKEAHVWQTSVYTRFAMQADPRVVRGELWYADRDGSNPPLVVPLTDENGRLIQTEAIAAEEARKGPLVLPETPLPDLREAVVADWQCGYCPFVETCKPEQHPAYDGERRQKAGKAAKEKEAAEMAAARIWPDGPPSIKPPERSVIVRPDGSSVPLDHASAVIENARQDVAVAKAPRKPRAKKAAPVAGPDPALSSAKAITDAATRQGAPSAETLSPATPSEKVPASPVAASEACQACSGTGKVMGTKGRITIPCPECLGKPPGLIQEGLPW